MPELVGNSLFALQKLADGVYAAITAEGSEAQSNAGIIDLGDQVVIFDVMGTPTASAALLEAAGTLTANPVSLAVNSHFHSDHVFGNQSLPTGVVIVASAATRTKVDLSMREQITQHRTQGPAFVQSLEDQLNQASDETARQSLLQRIQRNRLYLRTLENLELRPPTATLEGPLTIHGTTRRAQLIPFGPAHSPGDLVLFLPDDGILFAGDLGFFGSHPWMGDGEPRGWLTALERLESLHPTLVVPGHGPVGTAEDLALVAGYIRLVDEYIGAAAQTGTSPEELLSRGIPEELAGLSGAERFEWNVRALFGKMKTESSP